MKLDTYRKWSVIAYIVLIGGLVIVRDIFSLSVNKYIFVIIAAPFFLLADNAGLAYMLFFTFPLLWGLPGGYMLLVAVALFMIKKRKYHINFILTFGLAVFMELIAACTYNSINYIDVISYFCEIFLLLYYIYDYNDIDNIACLRCFLAGTAILCFVSLYIGFKNAPEDWLELFANGYYRFGENKEAVTTGIKINLNANYLAYYCIVGMTVSILLMNSTKLKSERFIHVVCIIMFVVGGFMSISRSWLLVIAVDILLLFVFIPKTKKNMISALVVTVFAASIILTFLLLYPELLDGFRTRLSSDTMSTAGGRTELFKTYLKMLVDDAGIIIRGTGVTGGMHMVNMDVNIHNGTEQILVMMGIPFGCFFIYSLLFPLVGLLRERIEIIYWLPIVSIIIFTQTIQFLSPGSVMMPFAAGVIALKAGRKTEILKNEN